MLIILKDWILWWVWSERTLLTVHHHHYYHHHHHHQPHHRHHHHHQHHHHRSGFCDAEWRDPAGCAIWASSPVLWFSVLHNPRTSALPHIIIIIARSGWPRVDRRALLRIKIAKNDLCTSITLFTCQKVFETSRNTYKPPRPDTKWESDLFSWHTDASS